MEHDIDEMFSDSPLKIYPNKPASQKKMVIRIKKQEFDIDIEGKASESDESVSYTCEFVQKDCETSEFNEFETIESIRQDENFIYPVISDSDDEDMGDATWQPSINSVERKHIKCLYPKRKINNTNIAIKCLKKDCSSKTNNVLEDIDVSKLDMCSSDSTRSKVCDTHTTKVHKLKKGMATPKQRLGRILKIHRMMK